MHHVGNTGGIAPNAKLDQFVADMQRTGAGIAPNAKLAQFVADMQTTGAFDDNKLEQLFSSSIPNFSSLDLPALAYIKENVSPVVEGLAEKIALIKANIHPMNTPRQEEVFIRKDDDEVPATPKPDRRQQPAPVAGVKENGMSDDTDKDFEDFLASKIRNARMASARLASTPTQTEHFIRKDDDEAPAAPKPAHEVYVPFQEESMLLSQILAPLEDETEKEPKNKVAGNVKRVHFNNKVENYRVTYGSDTDERRIAISMDPTVLKPEEKDSKTAQKPKVEEKGVKQLLLQTARAAAVHNNPVINQGGNEIKLEITAQPLLIKLGTEGLSKENKDKLERILTGSGLELLTAKNGNDPALDYHLPEGFVVFLKKYDKTQMDAELARGVAEIEKNENNGRVTHVGGAPREGFSIKEAYEKVISSFNILDLDLDFDTEKAIEGLELFVLLKAELEQANAGEELGINFGEYEGLEELIEHLKNKQQNPLVGM